MITKIALVQMSCSKDKNDNIKKAVRLISKAADGGAKIVCLPEIFFNTYFPQHLDINYFELAETIPGHTIDALSKIVREKKIYLIAPIFEKENDRVFYNTAVLIDPDGNISGKYRKNHIPHNEGYQEKYYFCPGNLGYPVFETPHGNISVSICWDHWFVETQRIYALNGADIIFSPTALGLCDFHSTKINKKYMEKWEVMLRGQAIQNGVFLAVNMRTGVEDKIDFCGGSFVADPNGEIISKLGVEEDILYADIDLDLVRLRHTHQQFLRDRRPDTYQKIVE